MRIILPLIYYNWLRHFTRQGISKNDLEKKTRFKKCEVCKRKFLRPLESFLIGTPWNRGPLLLRKTADRCFNCREELTLKKFKPLKAKEK